MTRLRQTLNCLNDARNASLAAERLNDAPVIRAIDRLLSLETPNTRWLMNAGAVMDASWERWNAEDAAALLSDAANDAREGVNRGN